jgi:glycosyltransferase involved in cell wall biosynthesis
MKVLYHHRTASRDGQAVHIDEMIQALRDLGHEVRVVSPAVGAEGAAGDMGQKVGWAHRLRALLPKAVYEFLELGYSWVAYRRLRAAVREFKPDVLYERYNLFMVAGVLLTWRFRLPYLVEVNAPLAQERAAYGGLGLAWLAHWSEKLVWRSADRVFVVTAVLGRAVAGRGVEPGRIIVTPNGINLEHFAKAPPAQQAKAALGLGDALVLGFTGFVRDWHGVDHVIRWLARPVTPRQARLLVVGDGPARPDLERLAKALGVGDRVRFTGVVSRHQVPSYVAAFDIALQPAVVPYASPLKLFEYLALGKAIVAPCQPNIEEILVDDDNALLFDAADTPAALEAALDRLAGDASLRRRLAERARDTIGQRRLTWAHNAQAAVGAAQAVIQQQGGH